jgi:hypothetical protein
MPVFATIPSPAAIFASMQTLKDVQSHASPGGRPQPLAFVGKTLWMGAWDTDHLYAIDPQTWTVQHEVHAPGKPYGLALVGDKLRVVISLGEDDDRYFYTFDPSTGFDEASKTPCPDLTGSHLASDGTTLYLAQQSYKRILAIDAAGNTSREIALPNKIGGMGFGAGAFYVISADDEFEKLELATLDPKLDKPQMAPLAEIPFDARSLASTGDRWWTCNREASEIVSFAL